MVRDLTESGDYYEGTPEAWKRYREAVNLDEWKLVQRMEEGSDPDFRYAP